MLVVSIFYQQLNILVKYLNKTNTLAQPNLDMCLRVIHNNDGVDADNNDNDLDGDDCDADEEYGGDGYDDGDDTNDIGGDELMMIKMMMMIIKTK